MSLPRNSRSPPTPSALPHTIPQTIPTPRPGSRHLQSPPTDSHRTLPMFSSSTNSTDHAMKHIQVLQPQSTLEEHSPAFLPIFTLIEDATTQQHFHPKIHYIFSDDTDTPLDAFLSNSGGPSNDISRMDDKPLSDGSRAIVLGLSPDLSKVAVAHCLSPNWQITGVSMGRAPQWLVGEDGAHGSVSERDGGDNEGLMLTIEGVGLPSLDSGRKGHNGQEGIYELANTFADRMAVIKRVIEFGQMQEIEEQQQHKRTAIGQRRQLDLEQRILEEEEQRHLEQEGL